MYYNSFIKSTKPNIVESVRSYLQLIEKTVDGNVLINGIETEFGSIEEARQYIKQDYISNQLAGNVTTEVYEEISEDKVANIIKEHHDIPDCAARFIIRDVFINSVVRVCKNKRRPIAIK